VGRYEGSLVGRIEDGMRVEVGCREVGPWVEGIGVISNVGS